MLWPNCFVANDPLHLTAVLYKVFFKGLIFGKPNKLKNRTAPPVRVQAAGYVFWLSTISGLQTRFSLILKLQAHIHLD